jgi:hypothetical protein
MKKDRDIEKGYTTKQMVAKLRRLADCLEKDKPFRIQIGKISELRNVWRDSFEGSYPIFCLISKSLKYTAIKNRFFC